MIDVPKCNISHTHSISALVRKASFLDGEFATTNRSHDSTTTRLDDLILWRSSGLSSHGTWLKFRIIRYWFGCSAGVEKRAAGPNDPNQGRRTHLHTYGGGITFRLAGVFICHTSEVHSRLHSYQPSCIKQVSRLYRHASGLFPLTHQHRHCGSGGVHAVAMVAAATAAMHTAHE